MAPERKATLVQWLGFVVLVVGMFVTAVLAFGDVRHDVENIKSTDERQWRVIQELRQTNEAINRRLDNIQFNQRADMEQRGVRYVEQER